MQSGWRVGTVLGIPLFIDPSWFLILSLVTFSYGVDPVWQETWGALAWLMGLVLALMLFSSVVLHELGHSVAALRQGIEVNSITLFLFGGVASIDRESKSPSAAFKVAIAGPLVSLGLFVILSLVSSLGNLPGPAEAIAADVANINLVLTLFNLIPGLPLDGGQVLKAAVWKLTNSRTQGIRWAARSGQILGWTAIVAGLWIAVAAGNFSGFWIAAIGWFAVRNAATYGRLTDLQDAMAQVTAAQAMVREFRVVNADLSVRQFADDYLLQEGRQPLYFAASQGRYRGLVATEDIRALERSEWDHRSIGTVSRPLLEVPSVRENTPIAEVIEVLEEKQLRRVTVLTPADAVAGTVDRGDIVRSIASRMGLSIPEAAIQQIKENGEYPPGLQLAAIVKTVAE